MKNINLRFPFFTSLQFLSFSLFAQKHFNLTVQLPKELNIEKVEAWLEDGKASNKIIAQSKTGNQLLLTGDYYSIYAAINLQYTVAPPNRAFANTFFIQEKPALIKVYPYGSAEYPFANYSLENAFDFKEEKKQMQDYIFAERQTAQTLIMLLQMKHLRQSKPLEQKHGKKKLNVSNQKSESFQGNI